MTFDNLARDGQAKAGAVLGGVAFSAGDEVAGAVDLFSHGGGCFVRELEEQKWAGL